MKPNTGTYVSGIGHGLLILWALVGGYFLRANDPLPLQSTEVSLLTNEEFAALSRPDPAPDVPSEVPEVVAPEAEEVAVLPAPALEPAPEAIAPPPVASERPETAPPEPEREPEPAPVVDVPPDAPVLPEPPSPQASDADTIQPNAEPQPTPVPRVAPEAAPEPEPDADVADTVTPEVTPDAEAQTVDEEKPSSAPEAAATEIVTEAEKPSAPTESVRPKSRPKPPARVADAPVTEEPKPQTDAVDDAVTAALAAGASSAETAQAAPAPAAPSGPPLTGGEKDALRVAVQQCWNVGSLSTDALGTTVVVTVSMTRDAKPETGSIRMLDYAGGSDAAARQAFEAARRAIIRCGANGFNLPVDKYGQWQNIEMTFNPENMRIK